MNEQQQDPQGSNQQQEQVKFELYQKHYNEQDFWSKMKRYAKIAGYKVAELALQLYYAMQSPNTPAWAKGVIAGALGYFILPVDLVPDVAPAVGFLDDFGVLTAAVITIAAQITPEVKKRAAEKLAEWFKKPE
jgi:uncharacterized membrane protein YkvA (DUF1232 family)